MKKSINDPNEVVEEMLEGFVAARPDHLRRLEDSTVIARKDLPEEGKVGIISGGGSGHEPAHAGYVGKRILSCAVRGPY